MTINENHKSNSNKRLNEDYTDPYSLPNDIDNLITNSNDKLNNETDVKIKTTRTTNEEQTQKLNENIEGLYSYVNTKSKIRTKDDKMIYIDGNDQDDVDDYEFKKPIDIPPKKFDYNKKLEELKVKNSKSLDDFYDMTNKINNNTTTNDDYYAINTRTDYSGDSVNYEQTESTSSNRNTNNFYKTSHYDTVAEYETITNLLKDDRLLVNGDRGITMNTSVQEASIILQQEESYYSNIETPTNETQSNTINNLNQNNVQIARINSNSIDIYANQSTSNSVHYMEITNSAINNFGN